MNAILPNYKKTILIVTFGRTGSTLLQGMINTIGNTCIKGENNNFCYGLYNLYCNNYTRWQKFSLEETKKQIHSWYGSYLLNEELLFEEMRNLYLCQIFTTDDDYETIGFKEIRYLPDESSYKNVRYLFPYLSFLRKLFKNVKFVFLTRNYDEVVVSKWWKKENPKQLMKYFSAFDESTNLYLSQHKDICFKLSYSELTHSEMTRKRLFRFLEAEYDEQKVYATLQIQHSYPACKSTGSSAAIENQEEDLAEK